MIQLNIFHTGAKLCILICYLQLNILSPRPRAFRSPPIQMGDGDSPSEIDMLIDHRKFQNVTGDQKQGHNVTQLHREIKLEK